MEKRVVRLDGENYYKLLVYFACILARTPYLGLNLHCADIYIYVFRALTESLLIDDLQPKVQKVTRGNSLKIRG